MTRLKLAPYGNDIIRSYHGGESAASLARKYNTSTTTVTNFLKKFAGMPSRPRGVKDDLVVEDRRRIVALHRDGMGPIEISRTLGRSKSAVYGILNKSGETLRGHQEWHPSYEQLCKKAATKEANGILTEAEQIVFDMLQSAGFECVAQLAVGSKNIDIAIPSLSVAVEVCCRGTFPGYIQTGAAAERIIEFGERGMHTYFLAAADFQDIANSGIDDMISWVKFLDSNPAAARQYRVVRCPFDLLAAGRSDGVNVTAVLTPANCLQLA